MMGGVAASSTKQRAAGLSVACNITLTGAKLAVGVLTNSVSVLSEALHSGLDLLAALMALVAVRKAHAPADTDHMYGHGKFESISGLLEGMLILAAVAAIVYGAVGRMITGRVEVREPGWGLAVMAGSALANLIVARVLFRVAKRTDSVALEADAWHHSTDVWTSYGVLGGLALITAARKLGFTEAEHLDPVVAVAVAAVISRSAWDITRRSWDHLVDRALPQEEVETIETLLREHYPEVAAYHELRTRKSGAQREIDVHLMMPGRMSVSEAHRVCDDLEAHLKEIFPGSVVLIHVEPPEAENVRS